MELDITDFYNNAAPSDYSASRMELGDNAGEITWARACEDEPDYNLLDTDEKRESFREHIRGFGSWSEDEIRVWSNTELNALCIQLISGDIRESSETVDLEAGQSYERIFKSDNGRIYYYIGN